MIESSQIFYLVASVLFVVGIKLMSRIETANRGNFLSAVGMLIAVLTAWITSGSGNFTVIAITLLVGTWLGILSAKKVAMTQMPQLVALFNGLGGLASCFVGLCEVGSDHFVAPEYLIPKFFDDATALLHFQICPADQSVLTATILSILIGGVTFSGSMVAYLKLDGRLCNLPRWSTGKNFSILVAILTTLVAIFALLHDATLPATIVLFLLSLLLGIVFVLRIGGGDMPVIIALLNSLSGLAASAAGFIIANEALVIAGCLVGASGLILTFAMCRAMNRSIKNVLFGNFGNSPHTDSATISADPRSISAEDAYYVLEAAHNVVFIPGYGMAVSQAQHAVKELADLLMANGASVRYAIHPVAGRMPGHMNVLLAEANVPYEDLVDIDDINRAMDDVDVALVIGANDIVNPAATDDPGSPIYGMPTIEAHRAHNVFILKRGTGRGFSGLQNTLFYKPNAAIIYGDAKETLSAIAAQFK